MNKRLTIVVLLIAIALTGYLVVDLMTTPGGKPTPGPTRRAGAPLFDPAITEGQITRLSVTFPDGRTMTAERDDAEAPWKQTAPFPFALEDWRVDQLSKAVAELRSFQRVTGEPAASAGVDKPRYVVVVAGERDGEAFEQTLNLGATAAAGRAYLKLADSGAVRVVNHDLHEALAGKKPEDFRGSSLVDLVPAQVSKAMLTANGEMLAVRRDGMGWRLAMPDTGRADTDAAEALINAIAFASVDDFVADTADDRAAYGLDQPQYQLTIDGSAGDEAFTRTLTIGRATDLKNEKFYAHLSDLPIIFTLSTYQVDRLRKTVADLRDKRVTPTAASDVRRVDVLDSAGKPVQAFELDAGKWEFADPAPPYPIDRSAVTALVKAITDAKADRFSDETDFEPDAVVKLAGAASDSTETLRLAHRPNDTVIVRRNDEPVARVVAAKAVEAAFAGPLAYRSKTVAAIDPAQIDAITVQRTGTFAATHAFKRQAGADGGRGVFDFDGYDRDAVDRLVGSLNPLLAASWRLPADSPPADVTVTVTTADSATHTLTLSTPTNVAEWSSPDAEPVAFVLSGPAADAFAAELRDRTAVSLSIDRIASVKIGETTYTRDASGGYSVDGDGKLDEEKVAAMFDTVAGLRVDRWVDPAGTPSEAPAATHRLAITPTEGDAVVLELWPAGGLLDDLPTGRVGGKYFVLTPSDYEALVAPVAPEPAR